MRGKGEGCKVEIYQTDSHFIRIPEKWMDTVTVRKNNVAITKVTVANSPYYLTVGGTTKLPDTVEIGPVLDIPICKTKLAIIERPEDQCVGLAERITVTPVSQADWDIIRFHQAEIQQNFLTKIRCVQRNSTISIFFNSLKIRLKVSDVFPSKECVVLQEMTEMEIIPLEDLDEEFEILTSDDELSDTEHEINKTPTKTKITSFLDYFNTQKNDTDSVLLNHFIANPIKEVLTTHQDDSIILPSVCKIPKNLSNHKNAFFAKISYRIVAKEGKKEYGTAFVKCIPDPNIMENRINLSPALIKWKELQMNEKVFLESLDFTDSFNKSIISEIELKSQDMKNAEALETFLQTDLHIFERNSRIEIEGNKGTIGFKNQIDNFAITSTNCKVKHLQTNDISFNITKTKKDATEKYAAIHQEQFNLCYNFCLASLDSKKMLNSQHALVTGVSGIGKTTFCFRIADKLNKEKNVTSSIINCSLLKGKRGDVIKKKVMEEIKKLVKVVPSILVLENLEVVFGLKDEEQNDDTSTNLALWLSQLLKQINQTNNCLMILGTCESIESLNSHLNTFSGSSSFESIFKLTPPSAEEKRELLKLYLNHVPDEIKKLELDEFLPCDIKSICDRIVAFNAYDNPTKVISTYTPVSYWGKSLKPELNRNLDQVGGMFEAKDILTKTILWQIQYEEIFESVGVRMPKGVLLYGAPGTGKGLKNKYQNSEQEGTIGKTMLAEALASTHQINFLPVKGPELLSKYIGASERNVRDLFIKAQNAKPCIIFFDEFDSLAPKRGHDSTGVTDRVVNQLLTQMDGVEGLDGVWIIATTSRDIYALYLLKKTFMLYPSETLPDLIDGALLRPGRIDKSVLCPIPSYKERRDILGILAKDYNQTDEVNLDIIAEQTEGYTGADLKAVLYNAKQLAKHQIKDVDTTLKICQEILIQALKETKPSVTEKEKARLTDIYTRFRSGKLKPDVSQRATLA